MRFLVTGTAGFIGFHLAKRLLDDGHDVVGIDAFTAYYDPELKEARHAKLAERNRYAGHRVRLEDVPALASTVRDGPFDIVVHLAAQAGVRYSSENPRAYIESNVVGTFNLLEALKSSPPRHLLIASTSSVYGANETMPFTEQDRVNHPYSVYAATKCAGELLAHSYSHLEQMPTTVFRFFTVYGPWGRPDMALFKFTRCILDGTPIEIFNHGKMKRDFTFIDDLVEAVVRLCDTIPPATADRADPDGVPGDSLSPAAPYRIVNIGRGEPIELIDFIATIEQRLGKPAIRHLKDMQPGDMVETYCDTSLLEALTNYKPTTSLTEGVDAFVTWYRDYYKAVKRPI